MPDYERRDEEMQRVKDRLGAVEKRQDTLERLANGMHYAIFGLPEDRTNNGLIGTMADFRKDMHALEGTINRALVVILTAIGAGVVTDVLARTIGS